MVFVTIYLFTICVKRQYEKKPRVQELLGFNKNTLNHVKSTLNWYKSTLNRDKSTLNRDKSNHNRDKCMINRSCQSMLDSEKSTL
jgi:hypothetical protein